MLNIKPKLEVIALSGNKFRLPPVVVAIELAGVSIEPYKEGVTPVLSQTAKARTGDEPEQGSALKQRILHAFLRIVHEYLEL